MGRPLSSSTATASHNLPSLEHLALVRADFQARRDAQLTELGRQYEEHRARITGQYEARMVEIAQREAAVRRQSAVRKLTEMEDELKSLLSRDASIDESESKLDELFEMLNEDLANVGASNETIASSTHRRSIDQCVRSGKDTAVRRESGKPVPELARIQERVLELKGTATRASSSLMAYVDQPAQVAQYYRAVLDATYEALNQVYHELDHMGVPARTDDVETKYRLMNEVAREMEDVQLVRQRVMERMGDTRGVVGKRVIQVNVTKKSGTHQGHGKKETCLVG